MQKSKVSCLPLLFFDELVKTKTLTMEDWFARAVSLGLGGVEMHRSFLGDDDPFAEAKKIAKLAEGYGLSISMLTGASDFTHPQREERERQVVLCCESIQLAEVLGAPYYRLTAGQEHKGVPREQLFTWVEEGFAKSLKYADKLGIVLAYENHYKDYYWTYPDLSRHMEDYLRILAMFEGSNLRVNFDTSNLIVVGEDPLALLEKVLPLVVYVHASDRLGENIYQHGVPGTGLVEFNRIFALLQKNNYTGWISVEYNGTGGVEALRTAIDFIRNNYKG